MKRTLNFSWHIPLIWLRFFIIFVLVIGICFRFGNLDKKFYWGDETYTSLWMSGHTLQEVRENLFQGNIIGVEDLQKYQSLNPDKGLKDTINSLVKDGAVHPPLYYAMLRLWLGFFGDSIAAIRAFSAVISLFVFPAIYWLCLELFNSSLVGWIAIALTAVSPDHILYAQEARPYILWAVTILLFSSCLLRAIRINKPLNWGMYAIAFAASLYTLSLSLFVAVGQGIYVIVTQRFRLTKTTIAYLATSTLAMAVYSPWIFVMINGISFAKPSDNVSLVELGKSWMFKLSQIFLDLGIYGGDGNQHLEKFSAVLLPVVILLVLLIGFSLWVLCLSNSQNCWLFLIMLIITEPLILTILAFRSHTTHFVSIHSQYFFPAILGIQVTVAYLMFKGITYSKKKQLSYNLLFIGLIFAGLLSSTVSYNAEAWLNKIGSYDKIEIARIINQKFYSLVVSDADFWGIMPYAHRLDPKVHLQIFPSSEEMSATNSATNPEVDPDALTRLFEQYSDVFFLSKSEAFINRFQQNTNYKIEPSDLPGLWQLKNRDRLSQSSTKLQKK
ncbi:glycosyltransferase family 39 protein [Planktothricoides raciborskii]|uniref:Glycosyltransferase family 39 protein n=1 Tax=Planktothricoides raciborskii FACHB-1370 TaxID=2949576 RepID=A0ABR8EBI7_9CYAN|nr:glycosyltransferase family 39 protein [Planktothricoides raciborskii]MBD2544113.1 glycosyltransferase family 39 protein [Planktothricoides raciborskii FACHB-1370]MBD2582598.1 glycosyltransferase family 39 protein [Planktothricoides raciborskii FACHB-1261]